MADDTCLACRWAEIQPSLLGLRTEEHCAHPRTERAPLEPGDRVTYPPLSAARCLGWPCGLDAALFEARRGSQPPAATSPTEHAG